MIDLSESVDGHLMLAAKFQYDNSHHNIIDVCCKIIGDFYGYDPTKISIGTLRKHIVHTVYQFMNNHFLFNQFLSNMAPENVTSVGYYISAGERYDFDKAVIYSGLSVLRQVKISRGGEILVKLPEIKLF